MDALTLSLIVAGVLQVLDVWSTKRAIANGDAEGNPFIAWLMERFGPHWWAPKLILAAVAYALIVFSGHEWALWALNGLYAVIVLRNVRLGSD